MRTSVPEARCSPARLQSNAKDPWASRPKVHRAFRLHGGRWPSTMPRPLQASRPEVDSGRIGIFGTSFGGGIAIAAAALDSRARAVVSNTPVCNGERWLRSMRPYWDWVQFLMRLEADRISCALTGSSEFVDRSVIAPPDPEAQSTHAKQQQRPKIRLESGQAIIEFKPEGMVERISPRPLLMIVATNDTRVAPDVSLPTFDRAREPKKLVILNGVDHHAIYELPARTDLLAAVLPWLKEHLNSGSDRRSVITLP